MRQAGVRGKASGTRPGCLSLLWQACFHFALLTSVDILHASA